MHVEGKAKVLADNKYPEQPELESLPGYNLGFHTISETGEEVSQELNFLFVLKAENAPFLEGDYLRDRAYEEAKPIVSHFRFDTNLRIRKILNYLRPPEGQPLETVGLVGFGVEQKQ